MYDPRYLRCNTTKLAYKNVVSQLKVTDLVLGLTHKQHILFADVMNDALSTEPIDDCYVSCVYLTSHAMIWSHYLEGKLAISCNLPHPPVAKRCDHLYMSIHYMLADFLAFATDVNNSWDALNDPLSVSTLSESLQGQCSMAEAQRVNAYLPTLPVMIVKWSDDFEPTTQTKQN